ncbi:MAG: phosphoribosylglycinamide formyltransferase, partial [Deltaproteobacteria bacterium]|nr:phosphoribosylglycinamide formyltransferase [Deltaproteobacteria bacterium]
QRAGKYHIPTFIVDYRSIIRQVKENPSALPPPDDFDLQTQLQKQTLFGSDTDPQRVRDFMITRAIAEARLLEEMKPYKFDLLVLAGFMRNFSPYFIDKVNTNPELPRIMNIHPALLPSFPGVDGYGDTFRYGCKVGGCTVHFVDYGEDSGPIIGQRAFKIFPHDTIESIKERGLKLEWELYPECIQLYAEGRLKVVRKTYQMRAGKTWTRAVVEILPPG